MHNTYEYWRAFAESARFPDRGKPLGSSGRVYMHDDGRIEFRSYDGWGPRRGTINAPTHIYSVACSLTPDNRLTFTGRQSDCNAHFIRRHFGLYRFKDKGHMHITDSTWRSTGPHSWQREWPRSISAVKRGSGTVTVVEGPDDKVVYDLSDRRFINAKHIVTEERPKHSRVWRGKVRKYHRIYKAMAALGAVESAVAKHPKAQPPTAGRLREIVDNADFSPYALAEIGSKNVWYWGKRPDDFYIKQFGRIYTGVTARRVRELAGCYKERIVRVQKS